MNYDWTESEQTLRDDLAKLFDNDARAGLASLETAGVDDIEATVRDWLGRLAPTGYLTVDPLTEAMRLVAGQEVVSAASGPLLVAVEATARLFGLLVRTHGSEALKGALADDLTAGKLVGAVALSDGASEAAENIGVTATADGDARILNGRKALVTNGPFADWIAVAAKQESSPVVCLVKGDAAGLSRTARLETVGYRGLAVCGIELEDVRVEPDYVLAAPLDPLRHLADRILSVAAMGLMHRSLEAAKAHANEHQRGGKPLMGYQEVRFKLAEMLTLHQTTQLLAYRAAWLVQDADGPDAYDAAAVGRSAKVFAADAAEQVAAMAMQILAGQGFLAGNPVEQAYRDAKYTGLAGTTTEVCRMRIADEMLERNPA